jgi:hypothetical protein
MRGLSGEGTWQGQSAPTLPPAGWYPDPESPDTKQRYWDGDRWTDRFADIRGHHLAHPQAPPKPLGRLAQFAIAGLVMVAVIEAFNIFVDINYIGIGDEILAGEEPTVAQIDDAERLIDAGATGLIIGYLLIGPITFLPWFYRGYTNLPRLGARVLRYRRGWAIGAWFIPIFNLFRPKQIANDLYRGSQPGAPVQGSFSGLPVASLLHWWWGLFIFQGLLGNVGGRTIVNASEDEALTQRAALDAIETEQTGFVITAVSSGLAIVAAALAILVVRRITTAQATVIDQVTQGEAARTEVEAQSPT